MVRQLSILGLCSALLLSALPGQAQAYGAHHGSALQVGYKQGHHHYRPNRHYRHHRSYRHHRHHRDRGAYLLGGVILGSVITHALTRPRDHGAYEERRVIHRDAPVSRRLFRDRDGNCFEIRYNSAGEELMQELDPVACAW